MPKRAYYTHGLQWIVVNEGPFISEDVVKAKPSVALLCFLFDLDINEIAHTLFRRSEAYEKEKSRRERLIAKSGRGAHV